MKILVDCDETLLETTAMLKKFYLNTVDANAIINETQYCSKWPVWNGSDQWVEFIAEFSKSEYFKNIEPLEGAVEAIKRLKRAGHSLSIITSSGQDPLIQQNRKENLCKFFGPDTFDEYIFCSLGWGNKKEALKTSGADILIDDCIHNCRDAMYCGILPILFLHPTNRHQLELIKNGENFVTAAVSGIRKEDNFDDLRDYAIIADNWSDVFNKVNIAGK